MSRSSTWALGLRQLLHVRKLQFVLRSVRIHSWLFNSRLSIYSHLKPHIFGLLQFVPVVYFQHNGCIRLTYLLTLAPLSFILRESLLSFSSLAWTSSVIPSTIHQFSPLSVFQCSLWAWPVRTADGSTKGGLPPVEFTIHLLPPLIPTARSVYAPFLYPSVTMQARIGFYLCSFFWEHA